MSCSQALSIALIAVSLWTTDSSQAAQNSEPKDVYAIAILPFQERGRDASELGAQASDLLFASLVVKPDLYLVEREDISKILEESELNLTGIVSPENSVQVGKLVGAKIIVTGSVIVSGDSLVLVAKIIGTETSRVLGVSVKGKSGDDMSELVEKLGDQIAEKIIAEASELMAKVTTKEDRIKTLESKLGETPRPSIWISVEERHVGQATIDPAAETELGLICRELGFKVIDHETGKKTDADILLTGEGFSQFASRRGNLLSVKARLELKAVNRTSGEVIAVDRQLAVALDLAEQVAGKSALQDAAGSIADRMLPKLVSGK